MFSRARRIAEGILGRGSSAVKPVDEDEFFPLGPAVKEAHLPEPSEAKHRVAHPWTSRSGIALGGSRSTPEVPSYHYHRPPIRHFMNEQVHGPRSEASVSRDVSERRAANPRALWSGRVPSRSRQSRRALLEAHYDRPGMPRWYRHMSEQVLGPRPGTSVSERRVASAHQP